MLIDCLRLTLLEVPLDEPVPMSLGRLRSRHACLVEVAVDGVWGVGESWVNHPAWAAQERLTTYERGVAPLLVGREVLDPPGLVDDLVAALLPAAEQAGAPGPVWQAVSGLDLALWDVLGKLHDRPVAALLAPGREVAASVGAYASGIGPSRVEELCRTAVRQGVRGVKVRLGFGAETDRRTLAAVRDHVGPDVEVYADANRAWTFQEALEAGVLLREHGVAWVEEPLRHDAPHLLAELSRRLGVPLAAGENLYGRDAFTAHAEDGALALLQPDVAKNGGLSTAVAVARLAAERGLPVAPHCYSGGVALAATVALAAACDAVDVVELDVRPNALRTALLDVDWEVRDGRLEVPDGPGLGVRLDAEAVQRHQVTRREIDLTGRSS